MNKLHKVGLTALATSLVASSAFAGDLSVSGGAAISYTGKSSNSGANPWAMGNSVKFNGSGELDNGTTFSAYWELDNDIMDDYNISFGMPNDMGTVKFCVSECGNNKKYAWDQSAYTSMSDTGYSEGIVYPDDMGSYASIQYHTPELPFGITGSVAHGNPKKDGQSGNTTATGGNSATEFSLTIAPIDGLTLTGSFMEQNLYTDGTVNNGQKEQNGAYAITYAVGNLTAGYGKSYKAPEMLEANRAATVVEYYENTGYSIGYAVNDDLSVSYTREESAANQSTSSNTIYDVELDSVQLAYSLGGATLSIARMDVENVGYAQNVDLAETIIAMTFAF